MVQKAGNSRLRFAVASHFCLNLHWRAHLQSLRNTKGCIHGCLLLSAYVDKLSVMFCINFTVFSK